MFPCLEEPLMFQVSRKPVGRSHISAAFISWGVVSWESVQFPFRTETFCALTTHVDTKTRAGMHADVNTCLCVHIHRGVNESPQRKGKRANVSPMSAGIVGDDFYVVSYWKLLGVKLLAVLADHEHTDALMRLVQSYCYQAKMAVLHKEVWSLIPFQDLRSCTGSSPVSSGDGQTPLEGGSLPGRGARPASVS